MQLVDQTGTQILPNGGNPAAEAHVAPACRSARLLRNSVIDSRLAIVVTVHPPPHACLEEPLHQFRASDAQRILEILVRPSAVTVDGNREALDTEFGHYIPRCLVRCRVSDTRAVGDWSAAMAQKASRARLDYVRAIHNDPPPP